MKTVLSVDVAKNKSMIMLINSEGEILIDTKEIKHNLVNFEKVKEEITEINPENLTVFMESTGTYHLPVERYFKENGFNTLVINSLTTKNNYDTIRKTKTDKKDCYRLAKLFFVNEVEYHELSKKDLYANLKAMTRQYFYLTQINISYKNRYKRLINICFPELEKIFKSSRIYEETALNFVKAFPHAYIVKEKRIDALYNNLYKTNSRHDYYYKRLAHEIKEIASNSYPGIDKDHSDVQNLSNIAEMLQNNIKNINELKERMIETAKQSPYFKIINSFYGIGEVLTAELLGELGDITRFDNHKQLIAFCGLDPTHAHLCTYFAHSIFLNCLHNLCIIKLVLKERVERVMNTSEYRISPNEVLHITNILRSLGLNTSFIGTKLINKSIQYIIKNDLEFITLEKIYSYLHCEYGFNIHSIRNNINYALSNRNKKLSIKNFEKVFGYEYYEKNFEPKLFIEEISNITKMKI